MFAEHVPPLVENGTPDEREIARLRREVYLRNRAMLDLRKSFAALFNIPENEDADVMFDQAFEIRKREKHDAARLDEMDNDGFDMDRCALLWHNGTPIRTAIDDVLKREG